MQSFNLLTCNSLLCLFWLPLFTSLFNVQFLPWHKRVKVATYLGSLVQLCCGREGHTWVCGSAHSGWTTLGLPQSKVACASRVYTAQSPSCSTRHYSKWELCFVHFPLPALRGLSHSGSRVLHKARTRMDRVLCALPRSAQLRRTGAWWVNCSRRAMHLNHPPGPGHSVLGCTARAESQVCHVSPMGSWSLLHCWQMSTIQDPRKTWLATGSLLTVWWKMWFLGLRVQQPLAFRLWLSLARFSASGEEELLYSSQLALLWYSFTPLFCEHTRGHHVSLEPFTGKVLFILFYFLSL